MNAARLSPLLLAAVSGCFAACSSAPEQAGPALPGFEGLERNVQGGGSTPPMNNAALPQSAGGPGISPRSDEAAQVGRVMVDLDIALRSWTDAMAQPRDDKNQETVNYAAYAIGAKVAANRALIEDQAISGAPRNRGIASAALGFAGDPAVLPLLLNNVADDDPEVVSKALMAVGVLAAEDTTIAPIADAIKRLSLERPVVQNAAFALFQLAAASHRDPDGALSTALLGLVDDQDAAVRSQALLGLGLVRANQALPALSDHLAADPAPAVRTAAAYALGQIGAQASTPTLVAALGDPDRMVAAAARAALARIHGRDLGPDADSWQSVMPRR